MIALVFEFDGVSAATRDLFDRLPQALEGRSVLVDYRPVAPPAGVAPWMRLLGGQPAPGRWSCEQVLLRGPVEPMEALASALGLPHDGHALPAPTGPVPAIVWDGRRFDGDQAIERLIAALPSA